MRDLEVTATGLTCPARTLGSEPGRLSNSKSTRPPSRSVKAGPAPLYGMCVTCTPAMLFIISPDRCKVVPNPADDRCICGAPSEGGQQFPEIGRKQILPRREDIRELPHAAD